VSVVRSVFSAAVSVVVASAALAQPAPKGDPSIDDVDSKPWDEVKTSLPPYPKPESLVRFYVGRTADFEFYVDTTSVSVSPAGTVRYTLVARSPSGAMNVSYEGIRCESYEHRAYAFGRYDGTWLQARNSQWIPIARSASNNAQTTLADDFFCPQGNRVRSANDALRALARGNGPGAGR